MTELLLIVSALIWLAGCGHRIYRLARYYQIEEYKSARFVRWWLGARQRWLPSRPALAAVLGGLMQVFLSEGGALLPGVIGVIAAAAAGYPPALGEVKKRFNRTARAKRLLVASWIIAGVATVLAFVAIAGIQSSVSWLRLAALTVAGFAAFWLGPLWLVLGNLAMTPVEAALRARFVALAKRNLAATHPVVIGITGSYGKTTTKTFLAHILNGRYKAYPTPKSYNTMMGVCIAINNDLANDRSVDYFIAEMGAYIPGEIRRICDLTYPQMSIVVEVGPQHLERFGSLENIAIAKYEIIRALPADGVGYFNWDNPYVRSMYERGYPAERIGVSRTADPADPPEGGPRFIASQVSETLDGLTFVVTDAHTREVQEFRAPIYGQHNVTNILLATAVAVHEGMSLKEVARRVSTLRPAESRLVRQTTAQGITILNDAYSANPVGVRSALGVLALQPGGRRVLITPGMVELGDLMEPENRRFGVDAAKVVTDAVLVGELQTRPIRAGLLDAGFAEERIHVFETLAEAIAWYQSELRAGDTVLFVNDLPDTYSR